MEIISSRKSLRVIVIDHGGLLTAQCLEHDVAATADNIEDLKERLNLTISLEDNFEKIPSAPRKYFEMWESANVFGSDGNEYKYEIAKCA